MMQLRFLTASPPPEVSTLQPKRKIRVFYGCVLIVLLFAVVSPLAGQTGTAQVFSDDFEIGDLSNWLSVHGTNTLSSNVAHSGNYSFAATLNGNGAADSGGGPYQSLTQGTAWTGLPITAYLRFYFYVDPSYSQSGSVRFAGAANLSSYTYEPIYLKTSGSNLILSARQDGTTPVSKGVWHALEIKYVTGSGNGEVSVYLDGNKEITNTGLTTAAMTGILLGLYGNATGTVYYDDVAISTAPNGTPTANVQVRHASPQSRTALRLMTVLWGQTPTDQLLVTLAGAQVYGTIGPSGVMNPIIDLSALNAGTYALQVQLVDSNGTQKAVYSENLTKGVNGTPLVAIDEWNNISFNGSKLFPITTWSQTTSTINSWKQSGYINGSGWQSEWAASYSPSQYQTFLNNVNCMPTIGPSAARAGGSGSDTANAGAYAQAMRSNPCVLFWSYYDEPFSVNGISAAQVRAVMNAAHAYDPNHPVAVDLTGYNTVLGSKQNGYLWPNFVADVYSFDEYPVGNGVPIAGWISHIDAYQRYNYGLTPWMEINEIGPQSGWPTITPAQLNMELWLAVIHGVKGVSYWDAQGWVTIPTANLTQAGVFASQIAQLQNVILSAPSSYTVSSNQTTPGYRVDAMLREDSTSIWVFAARLSEVSEGGYLALNTQLTVNTNDSATATVFGENRTVSVQHGVINDSFAPYAVHIYQMPKSGPPIPTLNPAVVK